MVKEKKMNESLFAKLHKEITIAGELIRARQEEKQGLLDEFTEESKRYFFGSWFSVFFFRITTSALNTIIFPTILIHINTISSKLFF